MTAAGRSVAVRRPPDVARELAWHLPAHGLMLAVMVFAMAPGAAGASRHLAGATLLTGLCVAFAPVARRRPRIVPVLLDAGAMTVVLVACAMAVPEVGGHAHGIDGTLVALLAGVGWLIARVRCTHGAVSVATGALSAVGLVVMTVLAVA